MSTRRKSKRSSKTSGTSSSLPGQSGHTSYSRGSKGTGSSSSSGSGSGSGTGNKSSQATAPQSSSAVECPPIFRRIACVRYIRPVPPNDSWGCPQPSGGYYGGYGGYSYGCGGYAGEFQKSRKVLIIPPKNEEQYVPASSKRNSGASSGSGGSGSGGSGGGATSGGGTTSINTGIKDTNVCSDLVNKSFQTHVSIFKVRDPCPPPCCIAMNVDVPNCCPCLIANQVNPELSRFEGGKESSMSKKSGKYSGYGYGSSYGSGSYSSYGSGSSRSRSH